MSNTPDAPAPAGWYPRRGDPLMLARWWDGDAWTHQLKGPLPPDPFPIQSLVDGHERESPPALAKAPVTAAAGRPRTSRKRPRAPRKPSSRRRRALVLGVVLAGVLGFGGSLYVVNYLSGNQNSADLTVGSCITIAAPILASDENSLSWTKAGCQTVAGGPVSYQVTQKLSGAATCANNEYIETYLTRDGKTLSVTNTYCLMENLAVGECFYADAKNFEFDVACTDPLAVGRISQRVETGGVTCATGEVSLVFEPPGRAYCVGTPSR